MALPRKEKTVSGNQKKKNGNYPGWHDFVAGAVAGGGARVARSGTPRAVEIQFSQAWQPRRHRRPHRRYRGDRDRDDSRDPHGRD